MTIEDIQNVRFTKVRQGYNTKEVDDFIDKCAETVEGLTQKLEILADKLLEYRNDEDNIRAALLNAQRLGDTLVKEARQKSSLTMEDAAIKADKLLSEAQTQAQEIVNTAQQRVIVQERELQRAQQEVGSFKTRMMTMYREHLALLGLLPDAPAVAAMEDGTVKPVVESVAEPVAEPASVVAESGVESAAEPTVQSEVENIQSKEVEMLLQPEGLQEIPAQLKTAQPEVAQETETRASRFGDLQFGDDYNVGGKGTKRAAKK